MKKHHEHKGKGKSEPFKKEEVEGHDGKMHNKGPKANWKRAYRPHGPRGA